MGMGGVQGELESGQGGQPRGPRRRDFLQRERPRGSQVHQLDEEGAPRRGDGPVRMSPVHEQVAM